MDWIDDFPLINSTAVSRCDVERAMRYQHKRYFPINVPVDQLIRDVSKFINADDNWDNFFTFSFSEDTIWKGFHRINFPVKTDYGLGFTKKYNPDDMTERQKEANNIIQRWIKKYIAYLPNHINIMGVDDAIFPHTDGPETPSKIIIPLANKDNFVGTTHLQHNVGAFQVPYMPCFAFNANIKHQTPAQDKRKVSINLIYRETIIELFDLYLKGQLLRPQL